MTMISHVSVAAVICVAMFVGGCASPSERFQDQARKRGFTQTAYGPLVAFRKGIVADGDALHIYLDGDGTPALRDGRIASDPTTRDRLILNLMNADPSPSILIGRPCYYRADQVCDNALWTNLRYGPQVVSYVVDAINSVAKEHPASNIVLIGYSGGGTIAMLAATEIPQIDTVITVAANLDIDAWTRHHGYAALMGSLNPASRPPLRENIRQFHYVGADDENVPASTMQHVVEKQANARLQVVPDFDHRCCWASVWPELIAQSIRR